MRWALEKSVCEKRRRLGGTCAHDKPFLAFSRGVVTRTQF